MFRLRRRGRGGHAARAVDEFARTARSRGREPLAVALVERLGDIVAASSIVAWLREQGPNLSVVWLGRASYREMALRIPGVDAYVDVECYGELAAAMSRLRGVEVLDLNLNGKSCPCCRGSWINRSCPDPGERVDVDNYYDFGPLAHAFARAAGLAWQERPATIDPGPSRPRLLEDLPRPFVLLHTESEETARNWHREGWRQVVDWLSEGTDHGVVHVGTSRARWLPRRAGVVDLAGRTDLVDLLAVVDACDLFVGIDSSVAHLANARRRPGVVLLGRYRIFDRYLPYVGHYAEGGALVVRYPIECVAMPAQVGTEAVAEAVDALRCGRPLGGVRDIDLGSLPDEAPSPGWREPEVGARIRAASGGLRGSLDRVERRPDGSVAALSGWVVDPADGKPPDRMALGRRKSDGAVEVRWVHRFGRLERPDVQKAIGSLPARFSGFSCSVPDVGPVDVLLFGCVRSGRWMEMPLP